MTSAQRYKRYFPKGEIGPVTGPDAFKAFPPLQGNSNWIYWRRDFHRALGAENAAYLAILNGECTAPATPRFFSTEEADVQVSYYRWVMMAVQFASYEETKKLLSKPTVEALHREKDDIEAVNAKLQNEYEKHLGLFGTAQARIMCYLHLCVDDLVSSVIENEQDPFKAFEMLRERYDTNSLLEQRHQVQKKGYATHHFTSIHHPSLPGLDQNALPGRMCYWLCGSLQASQEPVCRLYFGYHSI